MIPRCKFRNENVRMDSFRSGLPHKKTRHAAGADKNAAGGSHRMTNAAVGVISSRSEQLAGGLHPQRMTAYISMFWY
jgi:hypothetical protein